MCLRDSYKTKDDLVKAIYDDLFLESYTFVSTHLEHKTSALERNTINSLVDFRARLRDKNTTRFYLDNLKKKQLSLYLDTVSYTHLILLNLFQKLPRQNMCCFLIAHFALLILFFKREQQSYRQAFIQFINRCDSSAYATITIGLSIKLPPSFFIVLFLSNFITI